jgi:hypothetical protein
MATVCESLSFLADLLKVSNSANSELSKGSFGITAAEILKKQKLSYHPMKVLHCMDFSPIISSSTVNVLSRMEKEISLRILPSANHLKRKGSFPMELIGRELMSPSFFDTVASLDVQMGSLVAFRDLS